jgi:hypothetical protein
MPAPLAVYLACKPRKKIRGPTKGDRFLREIGIAVVVQKVIWEFGLPATRNRAKGTPFCACSVVADALVRAKMGHLSESGVQHIWDTWGEGGLPNPHAAQPS